MEKLRQFLIANCVGKGRTMADLSHHLGKSHAYIQQFVKRHIPKELDDRAISRIASFFGMEDDEFAEKIGLSLPARRPDDRRDGSRVSEVIEYDILASAGGGISLEGERERGKWPFPTYYLEEELGLRRHAVALISVKGDSMEPTLRSGDRVLVDTEDRNISQPGIFVLWDGDGRVVKRVERVFGSEPARVAVMSDNPLHTRYEVPVELVQVFGRVVWKAQRL